MKEPFVWILILNYNKWQDTIECINSIKKTTYKNYRILIVDNASQNNSLAILNKELSDIEIVGIKENTGYTGGNNCGIKIIMKRKADYILILNNDTIVEKDFLWPLVNCMEINKNAGAACGTILTEHNRKEIWYASGKIIKWRGLATHTNKGKEFELSKYAQVQCSKTGFITGCMMLLRTSFLPEIGLLNEEMFLYLDDIEYSIRIKSKGYELFYVPQSIIYHKVLGEKESAFKLYYSVRNRFLLIRVAFKGINKIIASIYFTAVILYKLFIWRFSNRKFYYAAKIGFIDYLKKNFYKGKGEMFFKS